MPLSKSSIAKQTLLVQAAFIRELDAARHNVVFVHPSRYNEERSIASEFSQRTHSHDGLSFSSSTFESRSSGLALFGDRLCCHWTTGNGTDVHGYVEGHSYIPGGNCRRCLHFLHMGFVLQRSRCSSSRLHHSLLSIGSRRDRHIGKEESERHSELTLLAALRGRIVDSSQPDFPENAMPWNNARSSIYCARNAV